MEDAMSNEAGIASDVFIDLSGVSLSDLPEYGDSRLLRALRRRLADDNEANVIAEWNEGI
jgi:FXSXX-COOH protein